MAFSSLILTATDVLHQRSGCQNLCAGRMVRLARKVSSFRPPEGIARAEIRRRGQAA